MHAARVCAEMIKAIEATARLILTNMNVLLARHSKLLNADCMMMLLQALANVLRGTERMQVGTDVCADAVLEVRQESNSSREGGRRRCYSQRNGCSVVK